MPKNLGKCVCSRHCHSHVEELLARTEIWMGLVEGGGFSEQLPAHFFFFFFSLSLSVHVSGIYVCAVETLGNVCVPVIVPHTLKNCWRRLRLECGWRREEGLGDSCLLISSSSFLQNARF